MRSPPGHGARRLLLLVGIVVLAGGGGAAAACKYTSLNCHLRSSHYRFNVSTMGNEIAAFEGRPAKLADLRRGLKVTTVARGFGYPTDFAFLPDGHVLVAEKAGIIQIVSPRGVVASRPFLDLRRQLDTRFFRGIVGLAVDPDFASHPYVYVAYTPRLGGLNSVKSTVVPHQSIQGGRRRGGRREGASDRRQGRHTTLRRPAELGGLSPGPVGRRGDRFSPSRPTERCSSQPGTAVGSSEWRSRRSSRRT